MKYERETYFVCFGIKNNLIAHRTIPALSEKDAIEIYSQEFFITPQEVLGPFYKKKIKLKNDFKSLKFLNGSANAIYKDWNVDAFVLKEPKDHAFLIFKKRVDNSNATTPKETVIVPLSELRFL